MLIKLVFDKNWSFVIGFSQRFVEDYIEIYVHVKLENESRFVDWKILRKTILRTRICSEFALVIKWNFIWIDMSVDKYSGHMHVWKLVRKA